jgi:hypothetical protein
MCSRFLVIEPDDYETSRPAEKPVAGRSDNNTLGWIGQTRRATEAELLDAPIERLHSHRRSAQRLAFFCLPDFRHGF